ncbi:MAG: two-component sensor histidine kinase [Alphaproteobacteria bacterium]|nr:two-component sensor histidine kinase [Alphaproteobacteria bacterium]
MTRFRSILSRVVALHVVAIGVTSVLIPLALYWLLNQAANNLHRDALRGQAVTVGSFLRPRPDGGLDLDVPADVGPLYSDGYGLYSYAVLDTSGRVLFSSRADGSALFPPAETLPGEWVMRRRAAGSVLFGVTVARPVGESLYWIQIAQDLSHRDVIIDDIVTSFVPRVAWITFPILLVLLLIDILIFRRALGPVREASTTAAAIGPSRTDVRLPEQSMPTEILPLVHAVNEALERLEAGYRAPDLVGMARTVGQVLDIAELESFIVGDDAKADLHAVCSEAVAFMAPLAVDMSKTIALSGADGPVWVRGHADALFRAVRNLVENAIRHTPAGGAIEVEVLADGTVHVLDDGPGVPEVDHESVFQRFWRRDRARADSRGLGLAIVARVAEAHGGAVGVKNRPEGGAMFTLKLRSA